MSDKKRKRMTNTEKARRAAMKKELQEKGFLPPDKPRLDRKKYIEEAVAQWDAREPDCFVWDLFLHKAIGIMLGATDRRGRASPEAVGVAKALKLAVRLEEFNGKLKEEGRDTYTLAEEYGYVKDILEA